jgi:hypothetical protein
MSEIIRKAHLVLVAAFGERIADPPAFRRRQEEERAEREQRAREAARAVSRKRER